MIALTLLSNESIDFINELKLLKEALLKRNIILGIIESKDDNKYMIKLVCDNDAEIEYVKNKISIYVSNLLYKIVIKKYKKEELYQFISENYFFLKQKEILELEERIMNGLNLIQCPKDDMFIYCYNKINKMLENIRNCVNENDIINIDGFLTFRMRNFREDIESIIDYVFERYMVEKEYNEFIRLLKYFVDIQESKIEEVNIFITDEGDYVIKDKNDNDILNLFLKELCSEKIIVETNLEDVIISGLITNVPQKIKVYGKEKSNNKEFLDTIDKVFGERVSYCSSEFIPDKIIVDKKNK